MPTTMITYPVRNDDQVSVDVGSGEGQPGGSSIMLGTNMIASGGGFLQAMVGSGKSIRGQKLLIVTVVENKNVAANNRTSQDVAVKGGTAAKPILQQQTAAKLGDKVTFVTVVTFI